MYIEFSYERKNQSDKASGWSCCRQSQTPNRQFFWFSRVFRAWFLIAGLMRSHRGTEVISSSPALGKSFACRVRIEHTSVPRALLPNLN
jgi:putative SOS response-associated peptidase YedK